MTNAIAVVIPDSARWAVHESAHGVAACVLAGGSGSLSIVPLLPHSHGRALPATGHSAVKVADQLVILLAGAAAEQRRFHNVRGDAGDVRMARELLAQVWHLSPNHRHIDEQIRDSREAADELVAANWDWIARVALALNRRRTVTGAQILELKPVTMEQRHVLLSRD